MEEKRFYTTPQGIAFYPHLNMPNTRFKPEGEYSVKLLIRTKDAEDLTRQIDKWIEESLAKAKGNNRKLQLIQTAQPPYQEFIDPQNQCGTDLVQFSFRINASYKKKNGGEWIVDVPFFDAEGKAVSKEETYICGGSILKVAFKPYQFFHPSVGAGVSLQLKAVQIIKLNDQEVYFDNYGYGNVDLYEFSGISKPLSTSHGGADDLGSFGSVPGVDDGDF